MIDVLVVDDDFRVAEINAKYVGRVPGFRVAARAHTAAEALTAVQRGTIDLVLLDHYLPDRTGLELVHRMREQGHCTDVIMITGASDVVTVQAAMRLGALHYLVKPFTFAALRTRLDSYAALRRTVDRVGDRDHRPGAGRPDLRRPAHPARPLVPRPSERPLRTNHGPHLRRAPPRRPPSLGPRGGRRDRLEPIHGPALPPPPGTGGPSPPLPQVRRHGATGTPVRMGGGPLKADPVAVTVRPSYDEETAAR